MAGDVIETQGDGTGSGVSRARLLRWVLIAVLSVLVALPFALNRGQASEAPGPRKTSDGTRIEAQQYTLEKTVLAAPLDIGQGGAIDAFEGGVYLVTRMGGFHRLDEISQSFVPMAWNSPAPVVLEGFYTRVKDQNALGIQDLKLRRLPSGDIEVLLSETRADPERGCAAVTLSRAVTPSLDTDVGLDWSTLWTSAPCIESALGSFPLQAGGEMAYLPDGAVAMFVGDFGNDDYNRDTAGVDPQSRDNDYGKVIRIDPDTGDAAIMSIGHRNPGGLVADAAGHLWLAENAAEGGDELNLIREGANYGWPVHTYTTHYGLPHWPVASAAPADQFAPPAFAFLPSPALSSVAVMQGDAFPKWRGNLIIGSLKGRALIRVLTHGDDVILTEFMPVGVRVRDLTIDRAGRIYVKTDNHPEVFRFDRAAPAVLNPIETALAEAGCQSCHAGTAAVAPSLVGLVGRPVAAHPDYPYSDALKGLGGTWDRARLAAYLKDPSAFAPGTAMPAVDLTGGEINHLLDVLSAEPAP